MQNQSNISKLLRNFLTNNKKLVFAASRSYGKTTAIYSLNHPVHQRTLKEQMLQQSPLGALLYGKQEQKHYDEEW